MSDCEDLPNGGFVEDICLHISILVNCMHLDGT